MSAMLLARDLRQGHVLAGGYKVMAVKCQHDNILIWLTHLNWPTVKHVDQRTLDQLEVVEVLY